MMKRTPSIVVHDVTLKEQFIRRKLDVSYMTIFGCLSYVHVPNELRAKLDPKAKKCVFIGYSLE